MQSIKALLEKMQHHERELKALQAPLLLAKLQLAKAQSAPVRQTPKRTKKLKSSQAGLSAGYTRTTLVLNEEHLLELKERVYENGTSMTALLDLAIINLLKVI